MMHLERTRHLLRHIFVENLALKILAVFIGFSMWFFVSSEQMTDRIIEVPVEIINKPPNLEIANDFNKSVLLQVQTPQLGKEGTVKNISATLDLKGAHQGENVILLSPDDFRLPASVRVLKIQPASITVILEPLEIRTVPVRARYSGKPAPNYLIKGVLVTPENVQISGPASHVRNVKDIATQSIDLTGQKEPVVQFVNLKTENPYITVAFKDRVRVEVSHPGAGRGAGDPQRAHRRPQHPRPLPAVAADRGPGAPGAPVDQGRRHRGGPRGVHRRQRVPAGREEPRGSAVGGGPQSAVPEPGADRQDLPRHRHPPPVEKVTNSAVRHGWHPRAGGQVSPGSRHRPPRGRGGDGPAGRPVPGAPFFLARDTRASGLWIRDIILREAGRLGVPVADCGVLPTPAAALSSRRGAAAAGWWCPPPTTPPRTTA